MGASDQKDSLLDLPGFVLRRAANVAMARLAAELERFELRISDATVLLLVADRTDMTSAEIGKELDIRSANMVPVLNRLEAAGLIERVPIDRKSQAIVLTPTGRDRLDEVRELTGRFEADLLSRIPERHRKHLMPALLALIG